MVAFVWGTKLSATAKQREGNQPSAGDTKLSPLTTLCHGSLHLFSWCSLFPDLLQIAVLLCSFFTVWGKKMQILYFSSALE